MAGKGKGKEKPPPGSAGSNGSGSAGSSAVPAALTLQLIGAALATPTLENGEMRALLLSLKKLVEEGAEPGHQDCLVDLR